jgi:hypothetical protein
MNDKTQLDFQPMQFETPSLMNTSRLLIIGTIAGFAFAGWGFLSSAVTIRPVPFYLMERAVDDAAATHKMMPEQKALLTMRVTELRNAHDNAISLYARSYFITLAGLLGLSTLTLIAFTLSRRKHR